MSRAFVIAASVISALTVGVGTPASAEAGAQSNLITLRVCNNTNFTALVAISYQPVGSGNFRNEGWYNVGPRECRNLAETTNAYMYVYAEAEGDDSAWQGDHSLCVEYPGPYDFWESGSARCESWQEVRGFVTLHAEDWGPYTWNLAN